MHLLASLAIHRRARGKNSLIDLNQLKKTESEGTEKEEAAEKERQDAFVINASGNNCFRTAVWFQTTTTTTTQKVNLNGISIIFFLRYALVKWSIKYHLVQLWNCQLVGRENI